MKKNKKKTSIKKEYQATEIIQPEHI